MQRRRQRSPSPSDGTRVIDLTNDVDSPISKRRKMDKDYDDDDVMPELEDVDFYDGDDKIRRAERRDEIAEPPAQYAPLQAPPVALYLPPPPPKTQAKKKSQAVGKGGKRGKRAALARPVSPNSRLFGEQASYNRAIAPSLEGIKIAISNLHVLQRFEPQNDLKKLHIMHRLQTHKKELERLNGICRINFPGVRITTPDEIEEALSEPKQKRLGYA